MGVAGFGVGSDLGNATLSLGKLQCGAGKQAFEFLAMPAFYFRMENGFLGWRGFGFRLRSLVPAPLLHVGGFGGQPFGSGLAYFIRESDG